MSIIIKTDPVLVNNRLTIETKVAAKTAIVIGGVAYLWFSDKGLVGGLQRRAKIISCRTLALNFAEISLELEEFAPKQKLGNSELEEFRGWRISNSSSSTDQIMFDLF